MSNFAFIPQSLKDIAEAATQAEEHIMGDSRAACFYARRGLETAVNWMYRHDTKLQLPYEQTLNALLHEPSFQNLVPEAVFQKARLIQKVGNHAVHSTKSIKQFEAVQTVKELHHICYWMTRTYAPEASREGAAWKEERIPAAINGKDLVPVQKLQDLEQQLIETQTSRLQELKQLDEANEVIQRLRRELEVITARSQQVEDDHDYSEAETRKYLIDVELHRAGWPLNQDRDREFKVTGMPNNQDIGYVDYVLWGEDGKPLGLVEAKRTTAEANKGQQQAKLYADCLEEMFGQRPVIFYTNGYDIQMWDDSNYPPRKVAGYYTLDQLRTLVQRRASRKALQVSDINTDIAGRPYQLRALGSVFEHFERMQRKSLLVMATGTGKTRTAIALVDAMSRAGWVKRTLFLADRTSLVRQAANAFKTNLPDSSPVNLVSEKDSVGRVYVSTYQTMMGLIDEKDGDQAKFGTGHFDLIIIDEAHRSVYQKFGSIFRYFDGLLMGLTATPVNEVHRNTYELFDLQNGVPTDSYELEDAVSQGYLVPPYVEQVDLRFPRDGIDYNKLTEEEKEEWEELDWGVGNPMPTTVNPAAINSWLMNEDTVDKVLKHLMENGHKVDGGDRLGKTIIFARNHDHAIFIEKRFNQHYPHYHGHFARVIDNYQTYAQSLIDEFSIKEKNPAIAISVDMLDTGIDVPEVVNLVFFKPVYSPTKFWQMIGRGTRLCTDLFAPDENKEDFRVFDFCFNYERHKEETGGKEGNNTPPLSARLFRARIELLQLTRASQDLPTSQEIGQTLVKQLHREISSMNMDNFFVREYRENITHFQEESSWHSLQDSHYHILHHQIAMLPTQTQQEEIEARLFDMTILRAQLAVAQSDHGQLEGQRQKIIELAARLEEKSNVPAVSEQLQYITTIQEVTFWEGITLSVLEDLRLRLRRLMQLIDKGEKKVLYTNFEDHVMNVTGSFVFDAPSMTSREYKKKVTDYLETYQNHIAIEHLRHNKPIPQQHLQDLKTILIDLGNDNGENLLEEIQKESDAPSFPLFIRKIVGMDRAAIEKIFGQFILDHNLNSNQIRFVELVMERLAENGVIEERDLFEAPFTNVASQGPDQLFNDKQNVIDGIFEALKTTQPVVHNRAG